jgi:transposase
MPQKSGNEGRHGCRPARVQEVIPVKQSKAYRSTPVKQVDLARCLSGRLGEKVVAGLDVGKRSIWVVLRFADETYLRPWRAANPSEVPVLTELLKAASEQVKLMVAMESSGTYADPLRQALGDAGLLVMRVSSKASHDWAESFDGVPSQHDGKDAAVVAELCAMGKSAPWPLARGTELEQEIAYEVDRLDAAHRLHQFWCGRLESRLARHWPEVGGVLKASSVTLLKGLLKWGSPAALAADDQAAATLARLGGRMLKAEKVQRLVNEARTSVGVRLTAWDQRRLREDARQALAAHQQKRQAKHRLKELAATHELLPALGKVVGPATACVLWACLGDPRRYSSAAAYRKAMGLNLAERSSGMYQGQLRISKRGSALARRFLYFAALRWVLKEPARTWYLRKKERDGQEGMRGVVAVMRKLPLALYAVAQGEAFDASRVFNGVLNNHKANDGRRAAREVSDTAR